MQNLPAIFAEWVAVLFAAGVAVIVLLKLWTGSIDLTGLLSEGADPASGPGKASLSRLQLLLFTFVIAGLYLTLCLEAGALIDIPSQLLGLLGISSGSYVLSKGIQLNPPGGPNPPAGPASTPPAVAGTGTATAPVASTGAPPNGTSGATAQAPAGQS